MALAFVGHCSFNCAGQFFTISWYKSMHGITSKYGKCGSMISLTKFFLDSLAWRYMYPGRLYVEHLGMETAHSEALYSLMHAEQSETGEKLSFSGASQGSCCNALQKIGV